MSVGDAARVTADHPMCNANLIIRFSYFNFIPLVNPKVRGDLHGGNDNELGLDRQNYIVGKS